MNKSSNTFNDFEYEIALSYASEDHLYVKQVATELRSQGVKLFYDKFEEGDLWGANLQEHLDDIYQNKSQYVLMFVSQFYAKKQWTTFEKKSALARALRESRPYILPYNFDDTVLSGIPPTTKYLSNKTPQELCDLIKHKLEQINNKQNKRILVRAVSTNLSIVAYRTLCLIYTYKTLNRTFSRDKISEIYKIMNYDIKEKIKVIKDFPNQLTDDEWSFLTLLKQNIQSLTIRQRNLDSLFNSISTNLINILHAIPELSFHKDDTKWYKIKNNKIEIIKESNAFAFFLHELNEFDDGKTRTNCNYSKQSKDLIRNHPDYLKYFVPLILKRVIKNTKEEV